MRVPTPVNQAGGNGLRGHGVAVLQGWVEADDESTPQNRFLPGNPLTVCRSHD